MTKQYHKLTILDKKALSFLLQPEEYAYYHCEFFKLKIYIGDGQYKNEVYWDLETVIERAKEVERTGEGRALIYAQAIEPVNEFTLGCHLPYDTKHKIKNENGKLVSVDVFGMRQRKIA